MKNIERITIVLEREVRSCRVGGTYGIFRNVFLLGRRGNCQIRGP